jgi:Dyp-type peroxidase family
MSSNGSAQSYDLSATAIDPADPAYLPLLQDLQGDILKPNGRDYATHVVFEFTGTVQVVRAWLSSLAVQYVTSATKQLSDAAAYRAQKVDMGLFGTLGLTAAAYEWMGFPLPHIPRDRQARFLAGMADATTQQLLNDPPIHCWECWSRGTIHAVLNLFDDSQSVLEEAVDSIQAAAAGKAKILTVQPALRLRNAQNQTIEPFGFVDGISQPVFLKSDITANPPAESYDPTAPLSLVLIPDPNGAGPYSHGSFLIYRKLLQDVSGFNQDVADLATKLNTGPLLAAAYTVGRFQDGTPVVLADQPTGNPSNGFQFDIDPNGERCPFQAHIRKANPRGDTVRSNSVPLEVERNHRIVRRAFAFQTAQAGGGSERGLQFFCYQSDIGNQFEIIQSRWSNMTHFLRMNTGLDGIIGQAAPNDACSRPSSANGGQPWPNAWGDPSKGTTTVDFGRWVSLRGGAYLFAPSISFFKRLVGA